MEVLPRGVVVDGRTVELEDGLFHHFLDGEDGVIGPQASAIFWARLLVSSELNWLGMFTSSTFSGPKMFPRRKRR